MDLQQRNLLNYGLYALLGAVIATGVQLGIVLAGSDPILWRPLAATFVTSLFGALATALGTSQLTRYGSEQLAKRVDTLRNQGVSRKEMTVVKKSDLP